MLGIVTTLAVLIVWWTLALIVGLWRVKPNDKRYKTQPGAIRGTLANISLGTLFALWTHNGGGSE